MTREAYDSGRIKQAMHDGNREFVSLIAYISALGWAGSPSLIYKGDSGDLQDSWVESFDPSTQSAFFVASENGWSSNAFGLRWLTQVFDPETRERARGRRRLLIVDGHSLHINIGFLEACDTLRIVVLILPPHSTHRLQPLDVGLFLPLALRYSQKLQKILDNSHGMTRMTKRLFWEVFKEAWDLTFTEKNITSAFKKTGIWPLDKRVVMK